MIIVQTPLRVSLFGGGTDFPTFYRQEGGGVLTTAIDKYIFVTIKQRFDDLVRVGYTQTELVESVDQIQHELIRHAFLKTGIDHGVEITTMGDIPSAGSGLGSSGTVTVGALHAMYSYLGGLPTADRLARESCQIEIDELSKPVGVQDQYIAAFGGFRWIEFNRAGEINVAKFPLDNALLRRLNENLLLFFTGITRHSGTVLTEQAANLEGRREVLRELLVLAERAKQALLEADLDCIGTLLHESWLLKQQLASNISNGAIDEMYVTALDAGALGGKITGAGGGGFLLLYAPEGRRQSVREALSTLRELPFGFERDGSKVIFNYRR
ncbi:MAG: GHMP kinase [Anaerolineales bacterium]